MAASDQNIERIKELTGLAKGAWTSLLTATLFIALTLVTLRHSEFLVAGEDVTLPVIELRMPTRVFFFCAPVLLAVLYINLNNQLLRLWKAFEGAPADDSKPGFRLADAVPTWMANDLALSLKQGASPHGSEWEVGRNWITKVMLWWLAPVVLLYAWYRFLPARDLPLTLVILACLGLMAYSGWRSRIEALSRLTKLNQAPLRWLGGLTSAVVLILLVGISWTRIVGPAGLVAYEKSFASAWDTLGKARGGLPEARRSAAAFLGLNMNIDDGELVSVGAITTQAASFAAFQKGWCEANGLPLDVCGTMRGESLGATNSATLRRRAYCERAENRALYLRPATCADYFAFMDARFDLAWTTQREAELGKLPELDLVARDLTGVSARNAELARANFTDATLASANLAWTNLEGATLIRANLTDLTAFYADLSHADLTRARLRGANLEESDLGGAVLIGADLRNANLIGANLVAADLRGADLRGAKLERAQLFRARLDDAILSNADLSDALGLTAAQLTNAVGDRTILPNPRELTTLANGREAGLTMAWCWPKLPVLFSDTGLDFSTAELDDRKAMVCPSPGTSTAEASGTRGSAHSRVDPYPRAPFQSTAIARTEFKPTN